MALKPLNSVFGFSVGTDSIINVIDVDGNVTANVLTVESSANLGDVGNITINGGSAGYYLATDGLGNLAWSAVSSQANQIYNGDSNVTIPTANGNVCINANSGTDRQWIFDTTGTLTAPGNLPLNGLIPCTVPVDASYTVYPNQQGLFSLPIIIDGALDVEGVLIQVDGIGPGTANTEILFSNQGVYTGNAGFTFDLTTGNLAVPGNISITGNIIPTSNNDYDLGTSTHRWGNLYLSGNTIYIGNSTITTDNTGNLNLVSGSGAILSVAGNAEVTTIQNGTTSIDVITDGNINFTVSGVANVVTISDTSLVVDSNVDFTGATTISLGTVANIKITGGTSGYYLETDGLGNLTWANPSSGLSSNTIYNGNSNVSIPVSNGNVYINSSADQEWVFDTTGNLTTSGGIILDSTGNISNTNIVKANYLVANSGCVSIGSHTISVDGSNAGIFSSGVVNLNLGLAANITLGSSSGNVTVQGNLISNGNITTTQTINANNIAVGDLYSKRAAVNVTTSTVVDQFPLATYRSAKYTIKVGDNTGYQAIEVLLVHDSINSFITIYGSLSTTGIDLVSLSSTIVTGNVQLLATAINSSTSLNLMGTYVPD